MRCVLVLVSVSGLLLAACSDVWVAGDGGTILHHSS